MIIFVKTYLIKSYFDLIYIAFSIDVLNALKHKTSAFAIDKLVEHM